MAFPILCYGGVNPDLHISKAETEQRWPESIQEGRPAEFMVDGFHGSARSLSSRWYWYSVH